MFPATSDAVVFGALLAGAGTGAVIDLRTRRVPNVVTASLALTGIGLAATGLSGVTIGASLLGLALGLALMLPGHLFGATGAGDVKLFAAIGSVVGWDRVVHTFLDVAIVGGLIALLIAVWRRQLKQTVGGTASLIASGGGTRAVIESAGRPNRFAYAPAIALGALLAALGV